MEGCNSLFTAFQEYQLTTLQHALNQQKLHLETSKQALCNIY